MNNQVIYFDNNSTSCVDKEVLEAMLPYFTEFYGNASSKMHVYGWRAEEAVKKAKATMAGVLNCEPDELVITSGATESINLLMKGVYEHYAPKGNHIVTCKTEHKAVLDVCAFLETKGAHITYLDVDKEGMIDLEELEQAISDQTILVSIMAANNETGVLQNIEKIGELCERKKTIFFTDATQFIGKMRCDVNDLNIHAMCFSAHKFHGPKGVGALYLRRRSPRVSLIPQIHGGSHQDNRRSGTLNVPGIVGMAKALEIFNRDYWDINATVSKVKNHFEHQLLELEGLRINGNTKNRLYNTSNITFPQGISVKELSSRFAFSSGSACSSHLPEPSHVLSAMQITDSQIHNTFRFSFSKYNTLEEVNSFLSAINLVI
jgi:cysteine desulfurase